MVNTSQDNAARDAEQMEVNEIDVNGIRGVGISFNGRGADFWDDGDITGWTDNNSMVNVQEMSYRTLIPYIDEKLVLQALEKAEEVLGVEFDWTII